MDILEKTSELIAIVPARRGSKGLVNKNLLQLDGEGLVYRTIAQALRIFEKVLVTTDIPDLLYDEGLVGNPCITIIERPEYLASDSAGMDEVLKHVVMQPQFDVVSMCLLQATSPLRSDSDIKSAIRLYESRQRSATPFSLVMSVVEQDSSALKHGITRDDHFEYFANGDYANTNRQLLPKVLGANGAIYIFSRDSFLRENGMPKSNIGVIEMPKERSVDIDSIADLELALELLKNR